jgi:hypothetical protein
MKHKNDSHMLKLWFETYIYLANTSKAWKRLERILTGRLKIPGLPLIQRFRWLTIYRMSAYDVPSAVSLARAEAKRDRSRVGKRWLFQTQVAQPTLKNKKKWLSFLFDEKNNTDVNTMIYICYAIFTPNQYHLQNELADFILNALPKVNESKLPRWQGMYGTFILPHTGGQAISRKLEEAIEQNRDIDESLMNALKSSLLEVRRRERIARQLQLR